MADEQPPSKNDVQAIFKRLRGVQTNKICFDCGSKNPTWASITYGVFLCIDCSAVHRSLGVHLSFIKSSQLDTNWTWAQLRAMQVGGNANALTFFRQHNCTTTDTNAKYHSRAAQLYKDKIKSLASVAMRTHGTELFIDGGHHHHSPVSKEVDFFHEHTQEETGNGRSSEVPLDKSASFGESVRDGEGAPSVDAALSTSPTSAALKAEPRKSTIGARKPVSAKKGLGAKKGMGAQKVKMDFDQLESRAQLADQKRDRDREESEKAKTKEEIEADVSSMRLAYQDMSVSMKKEEEKLKHVDPKKAQQMERLGMGFKGSSRSGVSHSAMTDMQTIEQINPTKKNKSHGRSRNKDFFDDYDLGFSKAPPRYKESPFMSRSREDSGEEEGEEDGGWERVDRPPKSKASSFGYLDDPIDRAPTTGSSSSSSSSSRSRPKKSFEPVSDKDDAQKKFGTAKSISSDQFFGRDSMNYEERANLSRFEGSASISSSDYFGDGNSSQRGNSGRSSSSFNSENLGQIKEGVKDGVVHVADKVSQLASGIMSSLQERYGN